MNEQKRIEEVKPPISPDVQKALEKMVEKNEYMKNLQIEMLEIERGYVKGRLMVSDKVLNPYGSVHGGCLFSLADITAGWQPVHMGIIHPPLMAIWSIFFRR